VRGQALVVLVCGALATVLFTLLGVHYSLALGVIAGLAEACRSSARSRSSAARARLLADGPGFPAHRSRRRRAQPVQQLRGHAAWLMGRRLDLQLRSS
jgi:hypothetical protein